MIRDEIPDLLNVLERYHPHVILINSGSLELARTFSFCLAESLFPNQSIEWQVLGPNSDSALENSPIGHVKSEPSKVVLMEFPEQESVEVSYVQWLQRLQSRQEESITILLGRVPQEFRQLGDGLIQLDTAVQPRETLPRLRFFCRNCPDSAASVFYYLIQEKNLETFPLLDKYRFETRLPGKVKTTLGCPFLTRSLGTTLPDNAIIGLHGGIGNEKNYFALAFLQEGLEQGCSCALLTGVRGTSLLELKSLRQAGLPEKADLLVTPKQSTIPEKFIYQLYHLINSHRNLERLYIADLDLFYFSSHFITEYLFPYLRSYPILTLYTMSDIGDYFRVAAATDLLLELESRREGMDILHYLSLARSPLAKASGTVWRYTLQKGKIEVVQTGGVAEQQSVPASDERTSISILPEMVFFDDTEKRVMEDLIAQYNQRHSREEIHLPDHEIVSLQQFHEEISPLEESGNIDYDLLPLDTSILPEYIEKNLIYCLDDFLPVGFAERFIPAALESCTYKNRLYALPHLINTGVLVYRKDLLEKYACPVPKTWEQLIKVSRQILEQEQNPDLYGFGFQGASYEGLTCNFLEFFWHNGGELFDNQGQFILNTENREALETLRFMVDLIHGHRISPPQSVNMMEFDGENLFLEGRLLFLRIWPRILSKTARMGAAWRNSVGITKLPLGRSGSSHIGVIGASCYVIPKSTPDPGRVVNFYLDFFDRHALEQIAIHGWSCSPFKEAYESPTVLMRHPYYEKMPDLFAAARQRIHIPLYSELSANISREVNLALRQEQTPSEALETIYQKFTMLMQQFGDNPQIQSALEYISHNFHLQIDRNTVSHHVGLSQSYFSALFKEHTGYSFSEYLMLKRIEAAKIMLAKTNRRMADVAASCGFPDISYFSQVFKRVVNMSPSRYRSSIHKSSF